MDKNGTFTFSSESIENRLKENSLPEVEAMETDEDLSIPNAINVNENVLNSVNSEVELDRDETKLQHDNMKKSEPQNPPQDAADPDVECVENVNDEFGVLKVCEEIMKALDQPPSPEFTNQEIEPIELMVRDSIGELNGNELTPIYKPKKKLDTIFEESQSRGDIENNFLHRDVTKNGEKDSKVEIQKAAPMKVEQVIWNVDAFDSKLYAPGPSTHFEPQPGPSDYKRKVAKKTPQTYFEESQSGLREIEDYFLHRDVSKNSKNGFEVEVQKKAPMSVEQFIWNADTELSTPGSSIHFDQQPDPSNNEREEAKRTLPNTVVEKFTPVASTSSGKKPSTVEEHEQIMINKRKQLQNTMAEKGIREIDFDNPKEFDEFLESVAGLQEENEKKNRKRGAEALRQPTRIQPSRRQKKAQRIEAIKRDLMSAEVDPKTAFINSLFD